MSGVVVDVPAGSTRRSFFEVLLAVLVGYVLAGGTLLVVYVPLHYLGLVSRPLAGPFPADGAWSLAADIGAATLIVLVAAWWIRATTAGIAFAPVSFGFVAVAVAVTGFAPFLTLRPVAISGLFALLATTWIVRRYAIGRTLPFPKVCWRIWAALAVVAFGVFGSYGAYHPLIEDGFFANLDARSSGTLSIVVTLKNPGWSDVTILHVAGGAVDRRWDGQRKLPYTLEARSQTDLTVFHKGCVAPDVNITYSVLGLTSSQRFTVGSLSSCQR